jgi:large subunit ribosomal protein L4
MKAKVTTLDNTAAGEIELNETIFGLPMRGDILQRMVRWQLARRQRGTHKVKTIDEVRGTGKKPFKQKGGGQARQGSLRSPQMRGGATMHGPVVRAHDFDLPKKVRKLALKTALSAKQAEGKLVILDVASLSESKTKTLADKISTLGWKSALVIDGPAVDVNFLRAARNLHGFDILPQQGVNVYDILRHDTLALTKAAIEHLEARLK